MDERMTGNFNDFKIISVHAPTEEIDKIVKDPFQINLIRYIKEFQYMIEKL